MKRTFTLKEAMTIGQKIGIDFQQVDLEQFRMGLAVELEHGVVDSDTNVTDDNLDTTAKIAWAHLKEITDYYTRLNEMETKAEALKKG